MVSMQVLGMLLCVLLCLLFFESIVSSVYQIYRMSRRHAV